MAVSENYKSRQLHITDEGTVLKQFFNATAEDWTDENPDIPKVNDYWLNRLDLIVTDVWVTWLDNTNCFIEVVYSTKGNVYRKKRADKVASVDETFDFSVSVEDASKYWDEDAEAPAIWSETWVANGGHEEDDVPPLSIYKPKLAFIQKMYLSTWDFNTIVNAIGKINSSDWIRQMVRVEGRSRRNLFYDKTGDDTGLWLFAGFKAEQVGDANIEVTMEFIYSFEGWNTPYGVPGVYLYETTNFNALPFPTDRDNKTDDTIRNL